MPNVISTLPTPGVTTNWGSASLPGLNYNITLLDNVFAAAGNGTSVGINIGVGKTISVAGTITVGGSAIFTGSATLPSGTVVSLTSTGVTVGPTATLYRNNATPAAADIIGAWKFDGNNATPTEVTYAQIKGKISATTVGAEAGFFVVDTMKAGTLTTAFTIGNNGEIGLGDAASFGTSGQVLSSQGTGLPATWITKSAGGGNYVMKTFTAPGTWTATSPGLKAVKVTVVAGGGQGSVGYNPASFGNGGGGGGAAIRYVPSSTPTILSPVAVTVGVGGSPAPSTAGGPSSFGALASATGGSKNETGGVGSSGDLNINGGAGVSAFTGVGGSGGPSILGGGGAGTNGSGQAGGAYGGGGGGGGSPPSVAGSGAAGIVIVEEFY